LPPVLPLEPQLDRDAHVTLTVASGGHGMPQDHPLKINALRWAPEPHGRSMFFKALFTIDLLIAGIVVYFFIVGLGDGSVSSFNMTLWLAILAGLAAILAGGYALRSAGRNALASLVLLVLAVPGALYAFFLVVVVFSGARWN
jgi:hypothetical protein